MAKQFHGLSYNDIRGYSQNSNISPSSNQVLNGIPQNVYSGTTAVNSGGNDWAFLMNAIDIYWNKPSLSVAAGSKTTLTAPTIATTSDLLKFIADICSSLNKAHERIAVLESYHSTPSDVAVTGISLNKSSVSLASAGATYTLVATISPSNATNKGVTWSSSNTAVATVSSSGVVTAVSNGTATITATAKGDTSKKATATVTCAWDVDVPVTGISVSPTSKKLTSAGATTTLTATITPSNATNKGVTWSSSNTAVATVSASGVVTAKANGSATITATANGNTSKKATCAITCEWSTQKYYYYAGRQDINNGGIGTNDWETTNTSAFLASSNKVEKNSIAEIKSALNGTVSVGASGTGKEEIVLVVPTEVANAITSIKTPTDKTIIYDKLTSVNGYTCIFIGEMSWSEIKISIS